MFWLSLEASILTMVLTSAPSQRFRANDNVLIKLGSFVACLLVKKIISLEIMITYLLPAHPQHSVPDGNFEIRQN